MEREYGRPFDEDTLIQQIGIRNVGAISGGRVGVYKPEGECVEVELPVSAGYWVRITLAWDDTYTVERVLKRRPKGKSAKEIKVLQDQHERAIEQAAQKVALLLAQGEAGERECQEREAA